MWGHGADEEMGTKEDREAAKGSLGERGKYSETNGTAGPEDERRQPEEAMASLDASLSGSVTQISTLISHKLQTPSSLPTSRRDKPPKLHLKGTWREASPFSVTQT